MSARLATVAIIVKFRARILCGFRRGSMSQINERIALAGLTFTRDTIEQNIPRRFEEVAAFFPHRRALTGNQQSWTYEALNREANRIAHAVRVNTILGIGCVAFLVDQSPEMVIAMLGILKAAKIYLGIHPGMPAAAQTEIIKDAVPDLLLTTAAWAERASRIAHGVCEILILEDVDERYPADNLELPIQPDAPSTLFYTSGTTGQPKGVVKSHRAVMHRVWLATLHDEIVPEDRQSLLTHCAFSASESDMFGVLLQGGTLCVLDVASQSIASFRSWIDEEGITLLHPPVLLFRGLLRTLEGSGLFPTVRLVALAGDVVVPADLHKWRTHFCSGCVLMHRFSTTETALLTVARFDSNTVVDPGFVTAGRPVDDKELVVVSELGQPIPAQEAGELVVRSRYLADGYWRHSEETVAAFQSAADGSGVRVYRTGDLVRFLPDGNIVFVGRRKHLAKIRGFRVDAREVESVLLDLEEVSGAAVIVHREKEQDRLWAFIVINPEFGFDGRRLRERLRAYLPDWKIPSNFRAIPALPTTLNGKVDRQLLASLAKASGRSSQTPEEDSDAASSVEDEVADIWQATLRVGRLARDDNFLELGGDSISAMMILNAIERRFQIRLTIANFFQHHTVRRLANHLQEILAGNGTGAPVREP